MNILTIQHAGAKQFLTGLGKNTLSGVAILALTAGSMLLTPEKASAVILTGSQTDLTEWTYDLTYERLDNYSIFQPTTTITLTGLFGVTGATGPISTDFAMDYHDDINLNWSVMVLDGGTAVEWTHVGPGTGNFGVDKHVYGFQIFASGAVDGLATLETDGFSRDTSNPFPDGTYDLDISGTASGPVASIPEPATLALIGIGLAGFGFARHHRQGQV